MIQGRCPTCSKTYQITALDDLPSFPFCSARCRLIDLGRWIDGKYAVPGASAPGESDLSEEESDDSA